MNVDEINRIFKLMEETMNRSFTGGFYTGGCYPKNSNIIYSNKINSLKDDKEIEYSEDDDWIYLTMELRGVDKDDLTVDLKADSIKIEVLVSGKEVKKDYPLPCKIDTKKSTICFNNYVLSLELRKIKEKKTNAKGRTKRINPSKV
jgi:HSP20 family molecular chaperone IbpA